MKRIGRDERDRRGARGAFRGAGSGALAVALGLLALGACYAPSIVPGGLKCAPMGKACPDGFRCVSDLCVADADGGDGAMCATPIASLCTIVPPSGMCDPVCQVGCGCGLACRLDGSGVKCQEPAGAALGLAEVCNPNEDKCGPGFVCLAELCGTGFGRCYRVCHDNSVCGDSVCDTPVLGSNNAPSGHQVCNLGDIPCDAVAETGCPDPALACFATGPNTTTCDCPGTAVEGAPCMQPNDCARGLACLAVGGESKCRRLCHSSVDCPSTCNTFAATFGYCS